MKCNIKGCQSYDESHDNNCNNKLVYMYLNKACYRLKEEERIKMTPPPPPQHPKPEKKQQYFRFNDKEMSIFKIKTIDEINISGWGDEWFIKINNPSFEIIYDSEESRNEDYEKLSNILTGLTE